MDKTLPENLVFLSAAPLDKYFQWQYEVFITNARKHGFSDRIQIAIWYPEHRKAELADWDALVLKYPEVKFFYYQDRGVNLGLYIPQLRPHILSEHFDKVDLKDKVIFYHDSDIIFNRLPDFDYLCKGSTNWESDTSSYLDYDYLQRKEEQGKIPDREAILKLCSIGNVHVGLLRHYTKRTGGAQYILKGIDGDFWRDVERMVLEIRTAFAYMIPESINARYFGSENEGFQSWCADMWAVNFALWSRNKLTDITPELDFSWATDSADAYHKKPIFHNAGATGTQDGIFFKGKWINESPLYKKHSLKPDTASYHYGLAIEAVQK